ncbi:PREDICTED: histone deacetylase [Prunus dulcis]|uniref:PREDICTED: histone deacetylase n=1 Tax=Prunus dulcis TaxID=3755 RepID=A0A5E4EX88_PRUDU|nr:RING finger protein ETP1-like [Prunus dulcis]VVA18348.1 PREDICTED: histone deacetylase [Prunus dulcis]
MAKKAGSGSSSPKAKTFCDHLALLSSDFTRIPKSDTPCKRCHDVKESWVCLSCKDVFCSRYVNMHFIEHYRQTNHCLTASCRDQRIWCYRCEAFLDARVIPQLRSFLSPSNASKDLSSSSKLENMDALMVAVADLISEPVPSFDLRPADAHSLVGHDELVLAKEGLQKIFDRGLEALADHQVQKEFLAYSAIFLAYHPCPSELKDLSSFGVNLSEETSTFLQAQHKLKVASNLSASITQKKFVLLQQASKYAEVKKEILATDGKVAILKAMIKGLESEIKNLEASDREKTHEVLDTIDTQVTTVRDGLVSDLAQASAMEGMTRAANELVTQRQSAWDSLRTTFAKLS